MATGTIEDGTAANAGYAPTAADLAELAEASDDGVDWRDALDAAVMAADAEAEAWTTRLRKAA